MIRYLSLIVLALAAAACDSTSPLPDPSGTYELVSFGAQTEATGSLTIAGGEYQLAVSSPGYATLYGLEEATGPVRVIGRTFRGIELELVGLPGRLELTGGHLVHVLPHFTIARWAFIEP